MKWTICIKNSGESCRYPFRCARVCGQRGEGLLFGSRLDENRRGGDVDLLVQSSPEIGIVQRARIKNRLESRLGLPVDVLSAAQDGVLAPFARMAIAQGVQL